MMYRNNNWINMATEETHLLVSDYINYRLQKEGYNWNNCPTLPPPSKVNKSMRLLGDEFEQRYREVFMDMCNQLHITPQTAYPTFITIANELFADDIKWGRIVALFTFGGALAVQCQEREMPDLVDNIVEWISTYVDTNLNSWVIEHGSWNGFVDFYENGNRDGKDSQWPLLCKIFGCAGALLGGLTLGAILAQKS